MRIPLVVLFLVIISLPLAVNIAGGDGADRHAENRDLAPFPTLDGTLESAAGYGNGFARWFEDHFGLRSALVRWHAEIRLFALGVSPATTVIKGNQGWYFYADDKAPEDMASDDPLTPEAIANWRAALLRARTWLRGRGMAFVFLIAPDKHVLYPEELPSSIARIGDKSRTDQLYVGLQDMGILVDLRPALFAAKARERIFDKSDTHWNDRGALVAYQAIIERARALVPAVRAPWTRSDFDAVARDAEAGDLAGMMGLKRVLREVNLALVPRQPRRARVVEPAGEVATAEVGRLVTEIPGSALPRAVIFRDSFVSRLAPFLSEHFSRAVYLWQNDFDAEVVEQERPDLVIQEIVGRHLYSFIPSPELVPER